jgi:CheY-like chemotaxis protein
VIRVVDNGAGIPSHALRQIFEPFRQGDSSITRKHGGLGLGLAIVNQLVALHDGTIEAHSEGLGRGSTFVVRIPALEGPNAAVDARVDRLDEIPRLDGLSVLVVEDEEDTRSLIEYVLHSQGANVTTSPSVADALEKMRASPDVIISDIGLPEVDGYSFMRKVREINSQTPAVALTAYARREDIENAVAAGYDLHIAKPIEPERLILAVDQLVRRRQLEDLA